MSALHMTQGQQRHGARRVHGFTLIELMVAMLLGLIVIGGVTSVFLAGQQTYRSNEALGVVADNSRTAFELLSRDIRNAGLTGCDNTNGRIANVVNSSSSVWYANWNFPLQGYDDATTDPALTGTSSGVPTTGAGSPVKGTSSIELLSTASSDVTVQKSPSDDAADFHINAATTELATGDIIMVCDFDHATIMQISYSQSSISVKHDKGGNLSPGDCSKGLGYPTDCSSANGNAYPFGSNSRIAVLTGVDWYIGNNPVGGTSLYRLSVSYNSSGTTLTPVEMVRNVSGMTISYLQASGTPPVGVTPGALPGTGFVTATTVTTNSNNWANVYAAQVTLTVSSGTYAYGAADVQAFSRPFTSITTVRNRTP